MNDTQVDVPSLTMPGLTLLREEVVRTRRFMVVAMILTVVSGASIPALGGHPGMAKAFLGTVGAAFLACGAFLYWLRDDRRYTPARALLPAAPCIIASTIASMYFGMYSPASMNFTLGIYFFGLSQSAVVSFSVYLSCALLQAAGMLAVAFGLLPDVGLIQTGNLDAMQKLGILLLVELGMFLTFLFARLSRRATLAAVAGMEQALRQVVQREALLQEAKADLEQALHGGGRAAGETVGKWRVGALIGRGGMGDVYDARHVDTDAEAALKLLNAEAQADPDRMRRFLREAEALAKLNSPHVVKVLEARDATAGKPYIAMELLRGEDLASMLRRERRLPNGRVLEIVMHVGQALEAARRAEIVHRDLKPQNLFRSEKDGLWKVLDFGVSKLGALSGTLTRGLAIGTPGYMAPEQASGQEDVDHRADVFALAVIAYRSLTGRPAFWGDDQPKIMFDIVYRQPLRPGDLIELEADVDRVLALGLTKKPGDRIERSEELARLLEAAFRGRLGDDLRERADIHIARYPWGRKIVE